MLYMAILINNDRRLTPAPFISYDNERSFRYLDITVT
jgi:hypothetical protein